MAEKSYKYESVKNRLKAKGVLIECGEISKDFWLKVPGNEHHIIDFPDRIFSPTRFPTHPELVEGWGAREFQEIYQIRANHFVLTIPPTFWMGNDSHGPGNYRDARHIIKEYIIESLNLKVI